jgi:protein-histidine pros-kinase
MNLSLAAKFNIIFLAIFGVGFGSATAVACYMAQENAREEALQNARVLMRSALAARTYTQTNVAPLLATRLKYEFLPQTVPSFAATAQLHDLLASYPGFTYKEATLNPTNPRDRAVEWEAKVVETLRAKPALNELVGRREAANGPELYVARPLQIKSEACLQCHSVPEAAPRTMIDVYGPNNGFGWKHMEIVGAQVVSVPMKVALQRSTAMFRNYMLSMLAIFLFLLLALNVTVHMFTKRIKQMAGVADQVSLGNFEAAPFDMKGNDELSMLARSFNRMRTSLSSAMKMLDD